jgi:hypothetical protein
VGDGVGEPVGDFDGDGEGDGLRDGAGEEADGAGLVDVLVGTAGPLLTVVGGGGAVVTGGGAGEGDGGAEPDGEGVGAGVEAEGVGDGDADCAEGWGSSEIGLFVGPPMMFSREVPQPEASSAATMTATARRARVCERRVSERAEGGRDNVFPRTGTC